MGQCCSKAQYQLVRRFDENAWNNWDKHFARQFYDIESILGKGAFSEVVAATQRDNGRRVALKVVFLDNPRLTEVHAAVLRDEVDIIQSLRHPNIVTFDCVMEDPIRRQFVIAEEILLGGTLTEELGAAASNNDDRLLAHVFKQLLSALAHMHDTGVVHRDLKPENVMFRAQAAEWSEQGALPVIIDFGMSTRYQPGGQPVLGLLGSPGFVAPEVIGGRQHTPAMDMFALGVMLYICIAGGRPMTPKEANTLTYDQYEAYEFPNMSMDDLWQSANDRVQSLVLKLLERDPAKRITAAQALQHPWVTADMLVPRPLSVRGDTAAVALERRVRLTAERRQANVEEMLRYMVMALQQREQSGGQTAGKAEDGTSRAPSFSVQSGAQYPMLTSFSAPQTGSATSFFQWMQYHLDAEAVQTADPPMADAAIADVAAEAAAAMTADTAASTRPLLRDVRSRSDLTHDSATGRSAAAAVAAAWRQNSEAGAAGSTTPSDFLVQAHLHRHLSLAQQRSGPPQLPAVDASAQPTPPSPRPGVPSERPVVPARASPKGPARAETMPVRRGSPLLHASSAIHPPADAKENGASPASSSLTSSQRPVSGAPTSDGRPAVRFADAAAGQAGGSKHSSVDAPVHGRSTAGMDPFPLYTQAKGNRLYSVVLAATRRAARRGRGGSAHASSPTSGSSPFSDGSSVLASDRAVGLEEISALAQVEWGLRRWRQMANRVAAPASPTAGGRAAITDALPEEVRRARDLAERALRFRGVSS